MTTAAGLKKERQVIDRADELVRRADEVISLLDAFVEDLVSVLNKKAGSHA